MSDDGVHIGEAAALFDLAPSTLRWWEKQGVLAEPARDGSRRLYRDPDLRRIGLAYLCCVTGRMPLDSAAVVTSDKADLERWRRTIKDQVDRLDEEMQRLAAARRHLNELLRCSHDDPALCDLLDPALQLRTPRGRIQELDLVAAAHAAASAREHGDVGPRRDETPADDRTRDETPDAAQCPSCAQPLDRPPRGRPRTYCSPACRQRAYRARRSGAHRPH